MKARAAAIVFFVTCTLNTIETKTNIPHFLYFDGIVHVREMSNFTISCRNIRYATSGMRKKDEHKIHSHTHTHVSKSENVWKKKTRKMW